jgi:transposase-like protein
MAQSARELGIHLETLRAWRRRARRTTESEPAAAAVPSLEKESRRLRRENARMVVVFSP